MEDFASLHPNCYESYATFSPLTLVLKSLHSLGAREEFEAGDDGTDCTRKLPPAGSKGPLRQGGRGEIEALES